jgi:hypothetical protein
VRIGNDWSGIRKLAPDVAPKNPPARLEWLSRNPLATNDGGKLDPGAGIASRDLERYAAISEAATNPPAVLESKADMQKRGQASPDDGDALALTFAQTVAPAEVKEEGEEEEFGRYSGSSNSEWMR